MAIPVVPVTCVAHTQDGAVITGARFTFTLTNTEVYGGFVVPRRYEGTTDATGTVVIAVFPNELGTKESMYSVVGVDNQGRRFLDGRAVVPAAACNLIDVVDLAAYANFDQAMQAKLDAEASAAAAQAQAAAAAASAAASAGSSGTSGAGADAAAASAGIATTQAGIATTQAGIATTQAGIATAAAAAASVSAALVLATTGQVAFFARNTAPTGWLKANGALVSRTTYSDLFAAIGTVFGVGDGSTTFGVPDLRGEFPRGWDDGRGVDAARAFGSAQADEIKAHTHTVAMFDSTLAGANNSNPPSGGQNPVSDKATSSTGGTETRPRNIALLACIKY